MNVGVAMGTVLRGDMGCDVMRRFSMVEWMYQIGGKKHWEDYNIVVRGYLRGENCDTDVAKAWVEAGGSGTPAHAVPSVTCSVVCYSFQTKHT